MARRVFFSFHYQNDIWRASNIRNSGEFKSVDEAGFIEHSLWERTKTAGEAALQKLIEGQLDGSTVTAILAGAETYSRRWVRYEIARSLERGNGLISLDIHSVRDQSQKPSVQGPDPLDCMMLTLSGDGKTATTHVYDFGSKAWKAHMNISAAKFPSALVTAKSGKLSAFYKRYDWVASDGHRNFSSWVEDAAKYAGR